MFLSLSLSFALALPQSDAGAEITIYNQGFGLVKDVRHLNLTQGLQQVAIEDVAQMIEANSVGISSLSAPGSFVVQEQNYQYDLISPAAILNKAVGGKVTLNRVLPNGTKEKIVGTLLSSPTAVVSTSNGSEQTYNGMVIRTDDGRILLDPTGEVEVNSIPEGLISKPTLLWDLIADKAGPNTVELSYLTQGMSWTASYVMLLNGEGSKGDFKGWVNLVNQSGATFKNAQLKLLAGDVQRAPSGAMGGMGRGGAPQMDLKSESGFSEEQFADYHLYTLQRPTDIRNNENKQVSLLEAFSVPVTKRLIIDPMRNFRGYRPGEGEVGNGILKPQIRIEFKNDKASHMGMPLPKGTIKVFQRDKSGSLQMLGEDSIDHTPRDENVSLVVGRAFDVVAERKRTSFAWIDKDKNGSPHGIRETFVIDIRNRKETGTETVTLLERHWGEYKITQSSMPYKALDSETIQFLVPVAATKSVKVEYTCETRW